MSVTNLESYFEEFLTVRKFLLPFRLYYKSSWPLIKDMGAYYRYKLDPDAGKSNRLESWTAYVSRMRFNNTRSIIDCKM